MTVPQGPVWQAILADALSAIPVNAYPYRRFLPTLGNWHRTGALTVSLVTEKKIEILEAIDESAQLFLGEAESLLDHCSEHQRLCLSAMADSTWASQAWLLVTVYYWCYFSALTFTRLTGRTTLFLDDAAISTIKILAPNPVAKLGAGTFLLEYGPTQSASHRLLLFSKLKRHTHDALWHHFFETIKKYARSSSPASNKDEHALFNALIDSATRLGFAWPSDLRNAVNYRPGFGYGSVQKSDKLQTSRALRSYRGLRHLELALELDSQSTQLPRNTASGIALNPSGYTRALVVLSFILNSLTTSLYDDITSRLKYDKRHNNARLRFMAEYGGQKYPPF